MSHYLYKNAWCTSHVPVTMKNFSDSTNYKNTLGLINFRLVREIRGLAEDHCTLNLRLGLNPLSTQVENYFSFSNTASDTTY